MSSNKISDSGARELCRVLPNTHIVSLDLSGNPINDSSLVSCTSGATTDMPMLFQLLRRSYHRLSRLFSSFSLAHGLPFKFDDAEAAQARSGFDVFGDRKNLAGFNLFAAFEFSSTDLVSDQELSSVCFAGNRQAFFASGMSMLDDANSSIPMLGFDGAETHNSAMMNPLMIGLLTIGTLLMCYFPYSQARAFLARLFNSFFGSADTATQSKCGFFSDRSSPIPQPEFAPNSEPPKCVEVH